MSTLIPNYESDMVQGIDQKSLQMAVQLVTSGSPLYSDAQNLISSLSQQGITEKLISASVTNVQPISTLNTYSVTSTSIYNIYYTNGSVKKLQETDVYTAYDDGSSQATLSNIKVLSTKTISVTPPPSSTAGVTPPPSGTGNNYTGSIGPITSPLTQSDVQFIQWLTSVVPNNATVVQRFQNAMNSPTYRTAIISDGAGGAYTGAISMYITYVSSLKPDNKELQYFQTVIIRALNSEIQEINKMISDASQNNQQKYNYDALLLRTGEGIVSDVFTKIHGDTQNVYNWRG